MLVKLKRNTPQLLGHHDEPDWTGLLSREACASGASRQAMEGLEAKPQWVKRRPAPCHLLSIGQSPPHASQLVASVRGRRNCNGLGLDRSLLPDIETEARIAHHRLLPTVPSLRLSRYKFFPFLILAELQLHSRRFCHPIITHPWPERVCRLSTLHYHHQPRSSSARASSSPAHYRSLAHSPRHPCLLKILPCSRDPSVPCLRSAQLASFSIVVFVRSLSYPVSGKTRLV
jgi:hypothetical protein